MTVALAKRQNVMNFHSRASNVLIESNLAVNKIPPQPHKFTSKKSKRQKLICKLYHKKCRKRRDNIFPHILMLPYSAEMPINTAKEASAIQNQPSRKYGETVCGLKLWFQKRWSVFAMLWKCPFHLPQNISS